MAKFKLTLLGEMQVNERSREPRLPTMAHDAKHDDNDALKWKLGSVCSLFNRKDRKWNKGRIVGSFSDEKGDWVKVQCDSEIHDVLTDDPDLRLMDDDDAVISNQKIKELQSVARQRPDIAPIIEQTIIDFNELQSALQSSSKS